MKAERKCGLCGATANDATLLTEYEWLLREGLDSHDKSRHKRFVCSDSRICARRRLPAEPPELAEEFGPETTVSVVVQMPRRIRNAARKKQESDGVFLSLSAYIRHLVFNDCREFVGKVTARDDEQQEPLTEIPAPHLEKVDPHILSKARCPVPKAPGCYAWIDSRDGTVLRVGKTDNLRSRLRSYWTGADRSPAVQALLDHVHMTAECKQAIRITVWKRNHTTQLERLLLEKYKPRFNVRLS